MALYEHVVVTRPDISPQQVDALVEDITKIVTEGKGSVGKTEYWGLRNLSYPIKKSRKAHYSLINIDAPGPVIHEIERRHRINEDVLRFMTVKVEELEEGPSAMLQKRDREDRPERGGDRFDRGPRRDRPRRDDEATETTEAEA